MSDVTEYDKHIPDEELAKYVLYLEDTIERLRDALREIREKAALHTRVDPLHIVIEIDSIAYGALEADDE